jgi:hypothetical protein
MKTNRQERCFAVVLICGSLAIICRSAHAPVDIGTAWILAVMVTAALVGNWP